MRYPQISAEFTFKNFMYNLKDFKDLGVHLSYCKL